MSNFDYLLSAVGAACMAACIYLGLWSGRAEVATTLGVDIGLLAAIVTFVALLLAQYPNLVP